jgi:UDP-N-acetyl-D-glucosamine dehydrogenase
MRTTHGRLGELELRLKRQEAEIAIVGLGYVGLPMALAFAQAGFRVTGLDKNAERVAGLNEGRSHVDDVSGAEILDAVKRGRFEATTDPRALGRADCVNIAVPTPLSKTKEPDLSFIVDAVEEVRRHLRSGQLIVLGSTTYPGTTHELYRPILESSGLEVGTDFCLAFAPERIDPGNKHYSFRNVPKVVGGETPLCTRLAAAMFEPVVDRIVPVSNSETAEMVKLLENTFRMINIGLANEVAMICDKLGLDVWEVIEAAATKPYGFMKFVPGPGLGGHCIPVDPRYLAWKMRSMDFAPRFIDLATEVNSGMPAWVVDRVARALNRDRKAVNGSRVLVLGVAYKADIADLRESPALDILTHLRQLGAELEYHDPLVPEVEFDGITLASQELDAELVRRADLVLITTAHSSVDYTMVVREATRVLDTRNAVTAPRAANVERL